MAVIRVEQLRKQYADTCAVDDLSFAVEAGEVYTLLGENGAGKSTTVEILEGHRQGTSGSVRVLDRDPWNAGRDFRDRIGIVLQSSGIETEFTVREVVGSQLENGSATTLKSGFFFSTFMMPLYW